MDLFLSLYATRCDAMRWTKGREGKKERGREDHLLHPIPRPVPARAQVQAQIPAQIPLLHLHLRLRPHPPQIHRARQTTILIHQTPVHHLRQTLQVPLLVTMIDIIERIYFRTFLRNGRKTLEK